MPLLPWKTTARASRISQIVADLQSPNRGGSLVVETGFPTSIVDLFVKHRDRLRRHSARRKSRKTRSKNQFHDSVPQLPCSTPEIDSTDSSSGGCVRRGNLEIEDLKVFDETRNRTETCVVGGGAAGGNGVCLAVLKMFVVAVFALSTKKLVVGITLSAFVLLLLDVVGKRAVRFLRPCSLIHKVSKHLWIGNYERESVPKLSIDTFLNESIDSPESGSSIEEIQLVESEVDVAETPDFPEDGANRRGTRGKRRMFEKLVRRKSGRQAIEKKSNNREELDFRSDGFDKASIEEQVNEEDDETLERDSEKPPEFDEQWQAMEVAAADSCEIERIEREGSSLNYPILVLVVLAGLFGGRFVAVVLTTSCCFMIKGFRIRH